MDSSQHWSAGDGEPPAELSPLVSGTELLTVAEVSAMLRVSKMTIYRMVHSGAIPHVRVNRSFRIPADAMRAILAESNDEQHSA